MDTKPNPLPFKAPLQIVSEKKRFPPVGRCIYCGTYSNKLELEHVLPFGIAGNAMLLPKASCRTCASITGKVEQACLRHLWWPFRTRIGAPTGSKRPETFTFRRGKSVDGRLVLLGSSDISADEYPINYVALLLQPPGILAGRLPTDEFEGQFWTAFSAEEMDAYVGDDEGMVLGPINPNTFARMLAKIAHAYAVGYYGYGTFKPLILDLILGKTETANYWVGGDIKLPAAHTEQVLHDMHGGYWSVDGLKTYLVVTIQLFAFLQSPIYHIVVGEVDGPGQKVIINQ
jgi:hypothetical protein